MIRCAECGQLECDKEACPGWRLDIELPPIRLSPTTPIITTYGRTPEQEGMRDWLLSTGWNDTRIEA